MQEPVIITQLDFPLIGLLTGFLSLPLKFLVDLVKRIWELIPSKLIPLIGIGIAYILCMVVIAAAPQISFSLPVLAECLLASLFMQTTAMGITEFQTKTNKVEERVQAALDAPVGTTKEQLKGMLKK